MVQEVLSEKNLHLVLLFLLFHHWLRCLLFHPLKRIHFKTLINIELIRTLYIYLLKLHEISELNKRKDLLKIFLTSLPSSVTWNDKECFLYWGCKALPGQGLGQVGLGGSREIASVAVFCYSIQQNLVSCCSWRQRENLRKHKSLAFCFSPSSRKKQSKIDMDWTDI